jgi:hypothetical protein
MSKKPTPGAQPARLVARPKRPAVNAGEWRKAEIVVNAVGASPIDVQVCFLEGLVGHPQEAEKFLNDPAKYTLEHGVVLDPQLVRDIVATVALGDDASTLKGRLSPGALRDVLSLRERPNQGVMEGAATVATVVTGAVMAAAKTPKDLQRAKGLTTEGVRLPGGRTLRIPGDLRAVLVTANNAVAVYATTTVSSAVIAASGGRRRGAAV